MTDKIKVYALSTCPYCKRTKRFLDEHKIEYDCVDVDLLDNHEQDVVLEEIEKLTGKRSFPVVVIGTEVLVGHDEERLRKALSL
jgi:glutaredoxin